MKGVAKAAPFVYDKKYTKLTKVLRNYLYKNWRKWYTQYRCKTNFSYKF